MRLYTVGSNKGTKNMETATVYTSPMTPVRPSIFLGGSISGAWDWQSHVIEKLKNDDVLIFNPRRPDFDATNEKMEIGQIAWEFRHLRIADAILFWFSGETLAPITLFELGRYSIIAGRPLFVGCDPMYKRRRDVEIQMSLIDPISYISTNLNILIARLKTWLITLPEQDFSPDARKDLAPIS